MIALCSNVLAVFTHAGFFVAQAEYAVVVLAPAPNSWVLVI